uniref:Uncharacterized protein n=1 Tax=Arundo donax TaxID=35708 RepID=A0A0A8YYE5_ARUDO
MRPSLGDVGRWLCPHLSMHINGHLGLQINGMIGPNQICIVAVAG